jgi:hypothetical protein
MKSVWETISIGLDQLWFTPLSDCETIQDRADAIETFLSSNGWTWDDVLKEIGKESYGQSPVCD